MQIDSIKKAWVLIAKASHFYRSETNYEEKNGELTLSGRRRVRASEVSVVLRFYNRHGRFVLADIESNFVIRESMANHFGDRSETDLLNAVDMSKYKGISLGYQDRADLLKYYWTMTIPANLAALLRDYDEVAKAYGKIQLFDSVH